MNKNNKHILLFFIIVLLTSEEGMKQAIFDNYFHLQKM